MANSEPPDPGYSDVEYDTDDPPDWDEDCDFDCHLRPDGQCGWAGSEMCDFECPNRNSEFFAGSAAWCRKHGAKRA